MAGFVGTAEISELLGVSRARVTQLSQQRGFPRPIARLQCGRIWDRDAIEEWQSRRADRRHVHS